MSSTTVCPTVIFPEDYDAQSELETPSRGYLSDVVVQLQGGSRYEVFFIDPVRLQQELTDNMEAGQPFFAEPNMVVLPEVTTESIRKAVERLARDGFFQHLKSL